MMFVDPRFFSIMKSCPVCFKTFDFKISEFENHVDLCLSSKPDDCPVCGLSKYQLGELSMNDHVNSCLDEEKENKNPNEEQMTIKEYKAVVLETIDYSEFNVNKRKRIDSTKAPIREQVKKTVPFYKLIPETKFSVDAFNYGKIDGVDSYFLSHFHSDHYTNLNSKFENGKIYCSQVTANLVKLKLRVKDDFIVPLELNIRHEINGIYVTLIDANQYNLYNLVVPVLYCSILKLKMARQQKNTFTQAIFELVTFIGIILS